VAATLGAAAVAATAWTAATRRQQKQSARLHRILVELLLNALSSGDPVTARHSRRVANLADVLAEAIGMRGKAHATLRVAALLHDMGKIEDELFPLIHSPRPLSDEERDQINHHPCESATILQPLEPFHRGLTRIVSSHHECWNGNGYPNRLKGEEIPLEARIISIADVFDAMTQPRRYHEPRPIGDVLAEIRRAAGQRFDPALVSLLDDPAVESRWVEIAEAGRREEERAEPEVQP
jgi:putative nucleotidyltransferase with HDIG domain